MQIVFIYHVDHVEERTFIPNIPVYNMMIASNVLVNIVFSVMQLRK